MNVQPSATDTDFSAVRATKRKLEDAFHRLDAAVTPTEATTSRNVDGQPPRKKTQFSQSIYTTLSKHGIKSQRPPTTNSSLSRSLLSLSKSAPNFSAILSRAANRTRDALTKSRTGSPAPSMSNVDYRPSSISSFLDRLSTFTLSTYANKPAQIDAVAASKRGWTNDGKDRLVCRICNVSWVVVGRQGMSREAANALIEKQRLSLVGSHKDGCPWKMRQCDDLIYRIPLQSPAATVRELKANAAILDPIIHSIEVKHPLTPNNIASLQAVMSHSERSDREESTAETPDTSPSTSPISAPPSMSAILTALFGWAPVPETSRPTLSRSTTRLSTSSTTPSLSRAASVAPRSSSPHPSLLRDATKKAQSRDSSLLHCVLCQRRIGLWAFIPPPPLPATQQGDGPSDSTTPPTPKQRQFDLLKEHRSYCPYLVRSTTVPTLPTTSASTTSLTNGGASASAIGSGHVRSSSLTSVLSVTGNGGPVEGWRAVLTVALRYRMVQRHQSMRRLQRTGTMNGEDVMEVDEDDGVNTMLEGVKSHGGKDLLKYVKGLLG